MELVFTVFSHDSYVMELPPESQPNFYKDLAYLSLARRNYKDERVSQGPIVRLYGTTEAGEKACVHVHGYYPYLYIKAEEYAESFKDPAALRQFLELVEALFVHAYKPINKNIVYRADLEQKYDFYGYHTNQEWFLKIYFYDPMNVHRLKELMGSKALNGKRFQCYEAHINYFMHFFADLNIYGLHQVTLLDFKFRRNIEGMQQQFTKLDSRVNSGSKAKPIEGLNLSEIARAMPALFSPLQKISSCYIEVDVHFTTIVNYLYNMMRNNQENSRTSVNSEMMIEDIDDRRHEYFEIKITKALDQFWYDERQRRTAHGIDKDTQVLIDYSKNIQSDPGVIRGDIDPLWVNFLSKGDNFKLLQKGLQSFTAAEIKKEETRLYIDKEILQGYSEQMLQNHEKMVLNVEKRIKFYGTRSRRIISEVMSGQQRQIPEWDEKSVSEGSGSDNSPAQPDDDNQSQSMKSQDVLSYMMDSRSNTNNMARFRNNYKVQKGEVKREGYFRTCEYCKNISLRCVCKQGTIIASPKIDRLFSVQVQAPNHNSLRIRYSRQPPATVENEASLAVEHQFPYYSSIEDYFKHHNIPQQFPRTKKLAQILTQQVRVPNHLENVVSIKNRQKLPAFWREILPHAAVEPEEGETLKLRYLRLPPTKQELEVAYEQEAGARIDIEHPLPPAQGQNKKVPPSVFSCDICKISFELILQCASLVASNPETDKVLGIVYSISNEKSSVEATGLIGITKHFSKVNPSACSALNDIVLVKTEKELLMFFALMVFKFDPDCLISYDQEKKGLYYLVNRASSHGMNYCEMLSRCQLELDYLYEVVVFTDFELLKSTFLTRQALVRHEQHRVASKAVTEESLKRLIAKIEQKKKRRPVFRRKYNFNITVRGRVVLNLFRIYEFELKLKSYSIEAVVKHLFGEQLYEISDRNMHEALSKSPYPVIEYQLLRINMIARIIVRLNVLTAVIEKSKLYGCNFESMLERGSQFKIESIMYRVSRLNGYLLLSSTKLQVAEQSVLECRPLVLEPPKQFYSDPVLVFDFQSLYPSVMIGYNLCYTTCLGSLKQLFNPDTRQKKFGVLKACNIDFTMLNQLFERLPQQECLKQLQKYVFVTPNKVAFVRKSVREGIIPRILLEFLMSRIMIKDSAKLYNDDTIKRLLNERQIAIKLFMNVMFGYTGASFSGRMPSSEIADSVVELARYLLTSSIEDIDGNPKYGRGKVVYGDTDSIFYHLKGYSVEQAFKIGEQIAKDMTKKFPYPVELKFEKVYDGLVLVSKKRYYGKCFDKLNGNAKYEGKGLECVRRDGIDLTSELMRDTLNLLLDTKDLSKVKDLLLDVLADSRAGLLTEDKYCFAKEVKMLKYSESSMPSHGHAARQLTRLDPNLIPKYGERMKYLVTKGQTSKVRDNVVPMYVYRGQPLNYEYYHEKMIMPALQRCFTSLANLNDWLADTPVRYNPASKHHFAVQLCKVCCKPSKDKYVCDGCIDSMDSTINHLNNQQDETTLTCMLCVGDSWISPPLDPSSIDRCVEWNCSNLYRRRMTKRRYEAVMPGLLLLRTALLEFNS